MLFFESESESELLLSYLERISEEHYLYRTYCACCWWHLTIEDGDDDRHVLRKKSKTNAFEIVSGLSLYLFVTYSTSFYSLLYLPPLSTARALSRRQHPHRLCDCRAVRYPHPWRCRSRRSRFQKYDPKGTRWGDVACFPLSSPLPLAFSFSTNFIAIYILIISFPFFPYFLLFIRFCRPFKS